MPKTIADLIKRHIPPQPDVTNPASSPNEPERLKTLMLAAESFRDADTQGGKLAARIEQRVAQICSDWRSIEADLEALEKSRTQATQAAKTLSHLGHVPHEFSGENVSCSSVLASLPATLRRP